MVADAIGVTVIGQGGLAALEERQEEMGAALAPAVDGTANDLPVEEERVGPLDPDDQHGLDIAVEGADDDVENMACETPEGVTVEVTTEVIGEPAPANDAADQEDDEGEQPQPGDDTPGGNSGDGDRAADAQAVPQLTKQALGSLLDECAGELIAPEDFKGNVDDQAFRNAWLGQHTPISQAVFLAEILRTGEYTEDLDENWVLLSDPDKSKLARDNRARITRRVHRGWSEDQKKAFILRLQARERRRTGKENRELDRRTIEALLALGMSYETIAELAGVSPNTVRNIETRAANDPNSKLVNTKKDRRRTWSSPENVAEAHRLRAEEKKNNSQIAKALGTTPATIGKLFKAAPSPRAEAISEEAPKPALETLPEKSLPEPPQVTDTRVPDDGIPNVVRLHLERRGLQGRQADEAYAKLLKPYQDEAREKIEGLAKHKDELLRSFLYHREAAAFAEAMLEQYLLATGKEGAT